MVIHFAISAQQTACGRTALNLKSSRSSTGVTCKNCCATDVYRAAQFASAEAASTDQSDSAGGAVVRVVKSKVAFAEWMSKQCGKSRLPRGRYFAGKQSGIAA